MKRKLSQHKWPSLAGDTLQTDVAQPEEGRTGAWLSAWVKPDRARLQRGTRLN